MFRIDKMYFTLLNKITILKCKEYNYKIIDLIEKFQILGLLGCRTKYEKYIFVIMI